MALCLFALMQSVPAYAVVEPLKTLQLSIRTTHKTIEVAQNLITLLTSVQNALLQGDIGAITAKMPDMKSATDLKSLAPILPGELQSVVSSSEAVPKIRNYIATELETVNFEDPLAQRDALLGISKDLSISGIKRITEGYRGKAEMNNAPSENEGMLSEIAGAANMQEKLGQYGAYKVNTFAKDVDLFQINANKLEAEAVSVMAEIRKAGISKTSTSAGGSDEQKQNDDIAAEKLKLLEQKGAEQ